MLFFVFCFFPFPGDCTITSRLTDKFEGHLTESDFPPVFTPLLHLSVLAHANNVTS